MGPVEINQIIVILKFAQENIDYDTSRIGKKDLSILQS